MNKGVYVVQNGKLKKVIASGYGDGLVKTVNGIEPDQRGDVDLGEIATPTDVEVAKDNAIKTARDLAKVDMEMATEGIRGFMHRGVWASGVEYEKNNLVIYNESVYQAVKDIKDSDKEAEVEEPETEVEDNEDIVEEVEDTEEPTEPTEEHNPVEINPEDEEFGKMYWRMFAPRTKERPRGTYAEAVNGIVPDETGNIELGQLAMLGDVSDGIDLAVERSGSYTDEQIELIKQEGIGGEVSEQDLIDGVLDAKDHANVVADRARADANRYTDIEVSKMRDEISTQQFDIVFSTEPPTGDDLKGSWRAWGVREEVEVDSVQLKDLEVGAKLKVPLTNRHGVVKYAEAQKMWDNGHYSNETGIIFIDNIRSVLNSEIIYDYDEKTYEKGNPNYLLSNIRQWLNSKALENWFQPTHDEDTVLPEMRQLQGFISYLPETVQNSLRRVKRSSAQPVDKKWENGLYTEEYYDSVALTHPSEWANHWYSIAGDPSERIESEITADKNLAPYLGAYNSRDFHITNTCVRGHWQSNIDTSYIYYESGPKQWHLYSFSPNENWTIRINPVLTLDMNTPIHKNPDGTYQFIDETRYKTAKVLEWYTKVQY